MTVAENVGMVPKLLRWEKQRIAARVDELLDLVGLDPAEYRDRYPKELSGGQRQRVGVARALGADPPVMLMDEPFGAIDPITRDRLQNEFLRIQADVRKTIVFVTHDIDEAIKMGDRIAILREQSHIAQYDTPEAILTAPADGFVEDFIGAGAALKRLNLTRVREVPLDHWPTASVHEDRARLRRLLAESEQGSLLLLDEEDRPLRWVTARDLAREREPLHRVGLPPRRSSSPTPPCTTPSTRWSPDRRRHRRRPARPPGVVDRHGHERHRRDAQRRPPTRPGRRRGGAASATLSGRWAE